MKDDVKERHVEVPAFRIIKRDGLILTSDILELIFGQATALHIRGAATRETCDAIVRNFEASEGILERRDGVPGRFIGSSHYKKTADAYFAESEVNRPYINALLGDVVDPMRAIFNLLNSKLQDRGGTLRLAEGEKGRANVCRALCWTGQGEYALEPHDDAAQVMYAGEGFEFVNAVRRAVVAINFYPSMPDQGGDLRIWNYRPTHEEKVAAGLEKTGYPYGSDLIEGKDYWDLGVREGDLVLIDGGYVHGVTRQSDTGKRLLLHAFCGLVGAQDAVWWT